MEKRKLLMAPLLVIVALAGFTAGHYMQNTVTDAGNQLEHAMRVELYVYKNGELVYYDPDDPATKQFTMLLAEIIAGDVVSGFTDTSGVARTYIGNSNRPGYVFVSYDPTYTYSYGMSSLPSSYEEGQISSGAITFNDAEKSVTLSASINIQIGGNITGVGLYSDIYADGNTYVRSFLLFYDPLDQPISVQSGDVITIVYKIVVP